MLYLLKGNGDMKEIQCKHCKKRAKPKFCWYAPYMICPLCGYEFHYHKLKYAKASQIVFSIFVLVIFNVIMAPFCYYNRFEIVGTILGLTFAYFLLKLFDAKWIVYLYNKYSDLPKKSHDKDA